MRKGIKPEDFSDDDLEEMGRSMIEKGADHRYVLAVKRNFRKLLVECGFNKELSRVSVVNSTPRYGIRLSEFPEPLRREVFELLRWKTDLFVTDRPAKSRLRPESAEVLQEFFCELYGFARNVQNASPTTLVQLLSEETLRPFVDWRIKQRKVKIRSNLAPLSLVTSIVKTYPPLTDKNLQWIPRLVSQLWDEAEAPNTEAKARKWVDYDELALIPEKLRKDAERQRTGDSKKKAALFRDRLLIMWLLVQPWRQRNLRECRLGEPGKGANLFKGEVSPLSAVARPNWVEEALRKDLREEFWQIHFRQDETKTGHEVHAILPKQLVPVLEEYLAVHRPVLLKGDDPGTLFVNDRGRPYCKYTICGRVERITQHYAGKRVNPHLFRDIVATKWLEAHPEDFLTVSKLLWHCNLKTTLGTYGRRYDESHANRRMEEWLESRGRV
jgi:integrase